MLEKPDRQVAYPLAVISKLVMVLDDFECDSPEVMFCAQCVQQILNRMELEGLLVVDRRDLVVLASWTDEAMDSLVPEQAPDQFTKGYVHGILHRVSHMIGPRNSRRPGKGTPQAGAST